MIPPPKGRRSRPGRIRRLPRRAKSGPRCGNAPKNGAKKKYSGSFYIALSAMSCALAVIFLLLGFFSDVLLGTGYIFAEIALMVPLAKRSYLGSFSPTSAR